MIYLFYLAAVAVLAVAGVVVWAIGACQGAADALKNWT